MIIGEKLGFSYLEIPFRQPVHILALHGPERVFGDEGDDAGCALGAALFAVGGG